jgi:hypothetical protein
MPDRAVPDRIEGVLRQLEWMFGEGDASHIVTAGPLEPSKRGDFEQLREAAASLCDELPGDHIAAMQIRGAPYGVRGVSRIVDLLRRAAYDARACAHDAA